MIDKIYIFETRDLAYLSLYVKKAKSFGYEVIVLSNADLSTCPNFQVFKNIYQHLSVGNSPEFEINCFARYFALASVISDEGSFILSDSDIYITKKLIDLKNDPMLQNVFVGSEGFLESGSEWQISPHFSIWNKKLLNDFVDYILYAYQRNLHDQFLAKYFEVQKARLGRTSISDMTLLYMWVNDHKVPYINSNSTTNNWGIDHNISALRAENGIYRSAFNRKEMRVTDTSAVQFVSKSRPLQNMSVVHFQGGYKRILKDFYQGNHTKFILFSMYINLGRNLKSFMLKFKS